MTTSKYHLVGPSLKWIKEGKSWKEDINRSEIIVESVPMGQVRKIIEAFLRRKQQKAFKQLYTCLSAAPASKCSAKESVMWLQISNIGSKECHGYTTLGELLRRLHLTGSVWQQGRFAYIINLTELVVKRKLLSLSGTSRKHLLKLIETLVQRVIESKERIRQMKRIVRCLLNNLIKKRNQLIGSKVTWYGEVELVRKLLAQLNIINVTPRFDIRMSIPNLPVSVQRHIIYMLDDHEDIESLSKVNRTLHELCSEQFVWKKLCMTQFSEKQIELVTAEAGNKELSYREKYHALIKKFEIPEDYADPLLLCERCLTVFWKETGHPCVGNSDVSVSHKRINPKKLISLL